MVTITYSLKTNQDDPGQQTSLTYGTGDLMREEKYNRYILPGRKSPSASGISAISLLSLSRWGGGNQEFYELKNQNGEIIVYEHVLHKDEDAYVLTPQEVDRTPVLETLPSVEKQIEMLETCGSQDDGFAFDESLQILHTFKKFLLTDGSHFHSEFI